MIWAIKNVGMLCIAAAICCMCMSIDDWTKALKSNTAQINNAVACSSGPANQLAASIDAQMLARFNRVRK